MTGALLRACAGLLSAAALTGELAAQTQAPPRSETELDAHVELWETPRVPLRRTPAPLLESTFAQSTNSYPDGDGPSAVAITPEGFMGVVANHTTSNLTVLELLYLTPIANIPTPEYPEDVVITPDGHTAITADAYNNTVSFFDLNSFTRLKTISTGGTYPYRVVLTADGQRAVVGCLNDAVISSFTIIDVPSMSVVRTFSSVSQGTIGSFFTFETGQSGYIYSQFGVTPDGSRIIAPDRVNSRVVIYNAQGAQVASLPCPLYPTAVSVSADGTRAVITHESTVNQISVVNIPAGTLQSFATPGSLMNQTVAITDNGREAISIQTPSNVVFTNLSSGATVASIAMPTMPQQLALYAGGTKVFASGNDAAIIDVTSRSLVQTLPLGVGFQTAVASQQPVALSLNNRYREEVLAYNLDPAGPTALGIAPTGFAPESDTPRTIALSPDGRTVMAANNVSGNACIWSLAEPDKLAVVDVGTRPFDVAYRPDGSQAAVVAADSNTLSLIDLSAGAENAQVVTQVTTPARPVRVIYSANGNLAYVLCIDAKVLVAVNTNTGAIVASANAGAPRLSYSLSYLAAPDLALSPDGKTVGVTDAGTSGGRARFFRASDLTSLGLATTGAYPLRIVYSNDSSRAYVSSYSGNIVSVIQLTGGPISRIAAIPTHAGPATLNLDVTGQYLYAGCYNPSDPGLTVIDTQALAPVASLVFGEYSPRAAVYSPACSQLFIACEGPYDDRLIRVHCDGPATNVLDTFPLSWSASDIEFSSQRSTVIAAQPVFDTLDILAFEPTADVNADGIVDLLDFFQFLDDFDNSNPGSDMNDDDAIDLADFFIFLAGFDTGCA